MTTDRRLVQVSGQSGAAGGPGERLRRLAKRRRMAREELLAIAVLLMFLLATVAVLATQWLDSAGSANATPPPPSKVHISTGGTS